jgi:hypothetical protein
MPAKPEGLMALRSLPPAQLMLNLQLKQQEKLMLHLTLSKISLIVPPLQGHPS